MKEESKQNLAVLMFFLLLFLLILSIVIPSFIKARSTSCQNGCINNLRMIDSGKEQAALANKWRGGDDCTPSNALIVNTYIKGDTTPTCPQGGSYRYNPIGTNPICIGAESPTHPGRIPVGI